MFFPLRTLLIRSFDRLNHTGRFSEVELIKVVEEALRAEFGDIIKTFPVTIRETRKDVVRVVIKNPLIAGESFLRQEKLLRRINKELGKVNRMVKQIHISS